MFDFVKKGQIVEGKVYQVKPNEILVALENAATEGKIYAEYYDNPAPADLTKVVKVGDVIRAKVTSASEGDDSFQILLSRLPLLNEEKINDIEKIYQDKKEIETVVKSSNDKGLILEYLGFELFLPYTLLDFELKDKKDELIGKKLTVLIEEFKADKRRPKMIATRKPIYEALRQKQNEERHQARQSELENIHTGDVLEGTVDSFESHAAFIKFNHISGMLRISQVSHHRIDKIEDVLAKGQKVTVKVIKKEGNRLDLSMKALQPTPYEAYLAEHRIGDTVKGKVVSKLPFGVLIELAQDVKGLLHKNEYSWNPKANMDAYIKIGDEMEVVILSKDLKKEKIALSKKAIEHNPWAGLTLRHGEIIEVRVEGVTKDGVNVSYESVDGFIPNNEAHNDPKVNIADHYQVGDVVKAIVTEFNRDNWVLKLSVRRLLENLERQEFEKYLGNESEQESVTLGDLFEDLKNKK
ncbi:S1 RNA-binding domain-containing protein [Acholeplasma hippikon]|uniref:RRP-S1 n=1 Tax=Acholeplasma hippikon TaxID=264636 RepID=A0A449BJJ4_9MOLU|nr:S1 RNA-binding domain-containing protein [Acholeplasma hippikon]VEU82563.1 RRP-S1 [Acholeplasma hippikon]